MSHLLAHQNTSYVSEDAVIDVSRVEGTDTWVPLHHADLITALEKKDLQALSDMAIPGIFEIWMAYTDWVVKLGDASLIDQAWLTESFENGWQIIEVDTLTDRTGSVSGYCVVTGPWEINYFDRGVNRADFCIDRMPGTEKYAFTYLILHSPPDEGASPVR